MTGVIAPTQRGIFSVECIQPEVFLSCGLQYTVLAKTGKILLFLIRIINEALPERVMSLATRSDLLDFGEL